MKPYTQKVKSVKFNMMPVECGGFIMGGVKDQFTINDELPKHKVTLTRNYYMSETPVTQALYRAVMGQYNTYVNRAGLYPVTNVSWNDVRKFLRKLNQKTKRDYCLPSEAEWEFAARGGLLSKGTHFAGSDEPEDVAWFDENSNGETQIVGLKTPNELGLYDMCGNVWEWCYDWYGEYTEEDQIDPLGPKTGTYCVIRGGAFQEHWKYCRVFSRHQQIPNGVCPVIGFRLLHYA